MTLSQETTRWAERGRMRENYEGIINSAIERIKKGGRKIGEGRTATVSALEEHPHICLKAIHNKNTSANRAHAEQKFLDELADEPLIAPRPICSVETDEDDFLFMETIPGFSVKDLIEKDLFDRLPEGIDFNSFLAALNDLVNKLHEQYRIYHRDLHSGNIMINPNRPNEPVILDFGDATKQFLSNENPYREVIRGKQIIYPDDLENLRQLRIELREYLQKKGVKHKL